MLKHVELSSTRLELWRHAWVIVLVLTTIFQSLFSAWKLWTKQRIHILTIWKLLITANFSNYYRSYFANWWDGSTRENLQFTTKRYHFYWCTRLDGRDMCYLSNECANRMHVSRCSFSHLVVFICQNTLNDSRVSQWIFRSLLLTLPT